MPNTERRTRTAGDDIYDYYRGTLGVPVPTVAGQLGYNNYLSRLRSPWDVRPIPDSGPAGDRVGWLFLFAVMVIWIGSVAIHDGIKGAIEEHNFRRAVNLRESVLPLGWEYSQSFTVPAANQSAFEEAYQALLSEQPKILECFYSNGSGPEAKGAQYHFWYGAVPAGANPLYRLVQRGHVFRSYLGTGALTKCPATQGEAWEKFSAFQRALPAPAE